MIKVNLLSPSDKLNVEWERINHLVIVNIATVVVIQLVFIFFLFASVKYLDIEAQDLDRQLENMQLRTEAKEVKKIRSNIENYDSQLKQATYIQKNQKYWTYALDNFSQIVPQGVKISSFSIEQYVVAPGNKSKTKPVKENTNDKSYYDDKYQVSITGIAKKRENLLTFEGNLKNSELFTGLVTSDSNYTKKENVDFKYSAFIKKEDLMLSR